MTLHVVKKMSRGLRPGTAALLAAVLLTACANPEGKPVSTARKQPNILVIVADDMGYSDLGAYGSEIATPFMDALVQDGRALTSFYSGAFCAPTRAMLMSGVDHHRVGLGSMAEISLAMVRDKVAPFGTDFGLDDMPQGYAGHLSSRALSLPEVFRDNGYHSYMAGKWHLAYRLATPQPPNHMSPLRFEPSAFPNAKGFERSFALLDGAGSHFAPRPGKPTRYDGTTYTEDDVAFPASRLPVDFYSTKTFTDKMLSFLEGGKRDDKPFFAYLAYTAPHWPLQAPDEDIARYSGRYDEGYDVIAAGRLAKMKQLGIVPAGLVPNPGLASVAEGGRGKKRWSELSAQERVSQARRMEVYAAMVSNMDRHIGRVIQHLKDSGEYDNTAIVFMSDNGADPGRSLPDRHADDSLANMGRAGSTMSYGERWTAVSSTPFRLWKGRTGAEGAVSVPAIVKLPRQSNGLTPMTAPMYVTDLFPTLLDIAGIELPRRRYKGREIESPEGLSFRSALQSDRSTPTGPALRTAMAGELLGMRYVRMGHWKLSMATDPGEPVKRTADMAWRLFDMEKDRGETTDLSAQHPELVKGLRAEWERYVAENQVIVTATTPPVPRDEQAP